MWACLSTGWLYSGTWREIVWNYRALFTHPQNSSYHYREFSTIFALFRYNQREKNSLGNHSKGECKLLNPTPQESESELGGPRWSLFTRRFSWKSSQKHCNFATRFWHGKWWNVVLRRLFHRTIVSFKTSTMFGQRSISSFPDVTSSSSYYYLRNWP